LKFLKIKLFFLNLWIKIKIKIYKLKFKK
jgi:hypothetical protein